MHLRYKHGDPNLYMFDEEDRLLPHFWHMSKVVFGMMAVIIYAPGLVEPDGGYSCLILEVNAALQLPGKQQTQCTLHSCSGLRR
jgi:hypothetical protein